MKKAIFLDRDGVINKDKDYVYKIKDFEFVENIFHNLRYLQNLDFLLFVITNQSGIGRKYYTKEDFHCLNNWMIEKMENEGITISQVEYCPHHPDDFCDCRKPRIGMIKKILNDFDIDLSESWLIGDRISDIECAKNSKIKNTIKIDNKISGIKKLSEFDYECENIDLIREIIV